MLDIFSLINREFALKRESENIYHALEHPSLKVFVATNSFYWFSKSIGGGPLFWIKHFYGVDNPEDMALSLADEVDSLKLNLVSAPLENELDTYALYGKKVYCDYIRITRMLSEETFRKFNLEYDEVNGSVIIPIMDIACRRIGATVRKIEAANKQDRYKVYLTTKQKPALWNMPDVRRMKVDAPVFLFEGAFSAMRWWQVLHTTNPQSTFFSMLGRSPSKLLKEVLNDLKKVYFVLDNDKAGLEAIETIRQLRLTCNYKILVPAKYPDEMSDEEIEKYFNKNVCI